MTVSHCPRCNESFRLPAGELPDDLYAQCPWCNETFPLSDVLGKLPPVLRLLSADGQPLELPQMAAAGSVATGLADFGGAETDTGGLAAQPLELDEEFDQQSEVGHDPTTAETVVEDSFGIGETIQDPSEFASVDAASEAEGEIDIEIEDEVDEEAWSPESVESIEPEPFLVEEPAEGAADDAAMAPMKVSPAPRRQKKGSPIKTAIGVVLGGLMALPIAGGLLLLIGRAPDLGFWPFDGGSGGGSSTRVAAKPAPSTPPQGVPLGTGNADFSTTPDPQTTALQEITSDLPDVGADTPADEGADSSAIRMPEGDVALVPIDEPSLEATDVQPVSDPAVEEIDPPVAAADPTVVETEQPDTTAEPATETETAAQTAEPATAPVGETEEMMSAATRSGKLIDVMSSDTASSGAERARRLDMTYEWISRTCELASGESESLQALASKLGQASILRELAPIGVARLEAAGKGDGIALVGRPSSGGNGPMLELGAGKQVAIADGGTLPEAAIVVVLGQVADDGAIQLLTAQPVR